MGAHAADTQLAARATQLLGELIRFNTVNPPGNERPAIEHLHTLLARAGFQCELLAADPDRPNLVARLGGGAQGPTLCYLGHVDTVLATAAEWTMDPFGGELAEGFVWGRGALDMKSQVAAEVAAAVSLAGSGWRPAHGELLIVAVADEETGGGLGAQWLTATHPDKVRCDMLVNEGGGPCFHVDGRRFYGVCCAEKGVFRFTVRTAGVAGHASMPKMGDNALLKMAPVLERFATRQPSLAPTAEPLGLLAGIGEDPHDPAGALARLAEREPRLAPLIDHMFAVTFTPTKISASEKINVIPSSAELHVDCRVPPGLGKPQVGQAIEQVLGGIDGLQIDFLEQIVGNRSPMLSPLRDAIDEWIAEHDPGAATVPTILPGFTDSAHFRNAFPECVAYGFFPHRHQGLLDTQPLIHAADERIDVRDMALGAQLYRDLALRLLG